MVFFELRWNYSPLKEKAVLLPDGLFIVLVASFWSLRDKPLKSLAARKSFLLLMRAARRPRASQLSVSIESALRDKPLESLAASERSFCSC
jgi:hypothetical protein